MEEFIHVSIVVGDGIHGAEVPATTTSQRSGALEGPGDNLQTSCFGSNRIFGRRVLAIVCLEQHLHRRGNVVYALGLQLVESVHKGRLIASAVDRRSVLASPCCLRASLCARSAVAIGVVEVHCLFSKVGRILDHPLNVRHLE